ncbi:hypothetical protein KSF_092500 [Reticulibacter mediterranei]|uniref:Uncharacterized protein n=1 Tax=Reticulibacter mediterranei TaxID=2778369 RepID=A0A8J3N5E6_9CHLR|nr:hypothetical protein KSF_092500 [Reticulibacter mediterranei]
MFFFASRKQPYQWSLTPSTSLLSFTYHSTDLYMVFPGRDGPPYRVSQQLLMKEVSPLRQFKDPDPGCYIP